MVPAKVQTPSLKRSRSVVACDGDTHAICQSAGDTVLQPSNDHLPGDHSPASADPLLIPPVAHILACADEQRASLRGALSVGTGALHGNGDGAAVCSSHCTTSACRNELIAEPSLAPCANCTSLSGNAHAGSVAALCRDHGLVQSVQLPHASVRRSHSAGLPVQWPDSGDTSAAISFKPRGVLSAIQSGGSLDAGRFGAKTCTLQSVSIQTQTVPADEPLCLQHAPVQDTGRCTTSVTAPAVSMVDKGVQAALLSEHATSCHMAVQATATCADNAVQCTLPVVVGMACPESVHQLEPSSPIQETALPASPPCAGASERVREMMAAVQQARVDWRRHIEVVQHFLCERIVPLLAVCSKGPPEEALVRLTILLCHQPHSLLIRQPPYFMDVQLSRDLCRSLDSPVLMLTSRSAEA